MAKRTYEERKDELSKKQIAYLEKANNLKEQIKELEKKQAEEAAEENKPFWIDGESAIPVLRLLKAVYASSAQDGKEIRL